MIDFLQGLSLVVAILTMCVFALAAFLIAFGTKRQKLVEAWEHGHEAGWADAFVDEHAHPTAVNPYLRPHEQTHRG